MSVNGTKSTKTTGGIKHDYSCDYHRDSCIRRSMCAVLSAWEAAGIQSGTGGGKSDRYESAARYGMESEGLMDICRDGFTRDLRGLFFFAWIFADGCGTWGGHGQKFAGWRLTFCWRRGIILT